MKRYTKVILALVLLCVSVISYFCGPQFNIRVGAGTGTNERIEEPEDMYDVLLFLSNQAGSGSSLYVDGLIVALSSEDDEDDEREPKEYSSMTVTQTLDFNSNSGNEGQQRMTRTLIMYVTEDQSYYKSYGNAFT